MFVWIWSEENGCCFVGVKMKVVGVCPCFDVIESGLNELFGCVFVMVSGVNGSVVCIVCNVCVRFNGVGDVCSVNVEENGRQDAPLGHSCLDVFGR